MAAVAYIVPPQPTQAPVVHGNDKFTMVTVPLIEDDRTEAVFVLNHLTGVLTGGVLNEQTGTFAYRYAHNVAADFQSGAKDPKFAIVTGGANLRATGSATPAVGLLYIAELSTGVVIAYALPRPTTRNAGVVLAVVKLDIFRFAESIGQ